MLVLLFGLFLANLGINCRLKFKNDVKNRDLGGIPGARPFQQGSGPFVRNGQYRARKLSKPVVYTGLYAALVGGANQAQVLEDRV